MNRISLLLVIFTLITLNSYAAQHNVFVSNNKFDPAILPQVSQGDTVIWTFLEGTHTTTSGVGCVADGNWDSGDKDSGETFSKVFDSAGTFPYFCTPHCNNAMVGQVTVRTSGINEAVPTYLLGSLNAYPNPFTETSTIMYELKTPARVSIQIIDISGKVVEELNPISSTGINKTVIHTDALPEGIYVAKLMTDGIVVENKLLIKQR